MEFLSKTIGFMAEMVDATDLEINLAILQPYMVYNTL